MIILTLNGTLDHGLLSIDHFAAIIRNGPTIRKPVATWEGDESPFEVSEMQWVHVEGNSLVDIDIKPLNGKFRPWNFIANSIRFYHRRSCSRKRRKG